MKSKPTKLTAQRFAALKRRLWAEIHRGTNPPITHPIPKLSLPSRAGATSPADRIEDFVRNRLRLLGGVALPAVVLWFCAGCTVVSYSGPGGERFSRQSFGTASAISALEVECGTNGVRRIQLQGYSSDSAAAAGAVTEAAVRAVLSKAGVGAP